MAVAVTVTVEHVDEDGGRVPLDPETAALLAGPNEQYSSLLGWLIDDAGRVGHGDREKTLDTDGRELRRRLLDTSFALDTAHEQRVDHLVSAAGIRHGGVEAGHDRGVISIFGPVRASRLAYRNRREANLYPADARVLPGASLHPAHSGPTRRADRPAPGQRPDLGSPNSKDRYRLDTEQRGIRTKHPSRSLL